MNQERKQLLQEQARGSWQREIVNEFIIEREGHPLYRDGVRNPVADLRGNAASYVGRYQESFQALLRRIREAGFEIERTPGPRGGEWGATYRVK
jgi:hypothetical protein